MSSNFKKRLMTSILLLVVLFISIFTHIFIFGLSLLILGFIVCIEFNNISRKLVGDLYSSSSKFNFKFFILMWPPFIYMFFIFVLVLLKSINYRGQLFFFYCFNLFFIRYWWLCIWKNYWW